MSRSVEDQLRDMAKLAILSNRISAVHEKNLKMYPLVFFNAVKNVKIDYDFERGQTDLTKPVLKDSQMTGGWVHFLLELDESQLDNQEKRFQALSMSTKNLFWPSTKVLISFNGKKVYESKDD